MHCLLKWHQASQQIKLFGFHWILAPCWASILHGVCVCVSFSWGHPQNGDFLLVSLHNHSKSTPKSRHFNSFAYCSGPAGLGEQREQLQKTIKNPARHTTHYKTSLHFHIDMNVRQKNIGSLRQCSGRSMLSKN